MEYIAEFILELVLEGSIEISKNRRIPRYIRYPLIVMLSLFFVTVIGLIFYVGILSLKECLLAGIFFLSIGVFMLMKSVIKFKKVYLDKSK